MILIIPPVLGHGDDAWEILNPATHYHDVDFARQHHVSRRCLVVLYSPRNRLRRADLEGNNNILSYHSIPKSKRGFWFGIDAFKRRIFTTKSASWLRVCEDGFTPVQYLQYYPQLRMSSCASGPK